MDIGPNRIESPRYQDALDYLFQRINYERTTDIPYRSRSFKLDRMRHLMDALGNPEQKLKIVHIAGTKGKGSTSAFLANILWKSGHHVGRFTSPHLERLEERFWVDGESCTADDIVQLVETIQPIVARMDETSSPEDRLTFFEITTAMGFLLFAQRNVDFAVIEVGLGGRLDSTNICQPLLCIITSISRDHTALLGETLAEIAGEKAGIIKQGVPVISGVGAEDAQQVVSKIAAKKKASLFHAGTDFQSSPIDRTKIEANTGPPFQQEFEFRWQSEPCQTYAIGVKGNHQVANAGLAVAAVRILRDAGHKIHNDVVRDGLATTSLPARIECLSERPAVIVDAAHNDASAAALVTVLQEHFPHRRRHLVFASSGDKEHAAVLKQLLPAFDQVWLTKYSFSPRTTDTSYLRDIAEGIETNRSILILTTDEAKSAFHEAMAAAGLDDVVVVTGSFFIAAEFKRFWNETSDNTSRATSSAAQ